MIPLEKAFRGKRVLVTGHTGFKGGWLCVWLKALGAKVSGLALAPERLGSFFHSAAVADGMGSGLGDIRDFRTVASALHAAEPEFVFHLAAQALVRQSYREPVDTFATNVLGTVHVLEAVRWTPSVKAVVVVTSDKCYENPEDGRPRREGDPMGGHDPYSASKGAAELAVASYRRAFLSVRPVGVASARAGNVIGGGDWAEDRILPDCVRSLIQGQRIPVRFPDAVRPWQHVLEPLSGYLWLGARLAEDPARFSGSWNFGPGDGEEVPVKKLVAKLLESWGAPAWMLQEAREPSAPHEAATLALDASKAATELGWKPVWKVPEAVRAAVEWYKAACAEGFDGAAMTSRQIEAYTAKAARAGLPWAAERKAAARRRPVAGGHAA